MNKTVHYLIILLACTLLLTSSCDTNGPRLRLGCFPTSTPGTRFLSADKLGNHSYGFSPLEKNGITYTCRGGHIDITHLRIGADNTRYMADTLYKGIMKGKTDFSFVLSGDASRHKVKLSYPENWNNQKNKTIAREVSIQLGQYIAFNATTWHEILTWFGYHTMIIFPEFQSAFSWEDTYSNLLGTRIAAKALQDTEHKFNKAMTLALNEEMENLGACSARDAHKAAQQVRGRWFKGNIAVAIKKRNLDIGLDDGFVTPMIVPDFCLDAKPKPYPAPSPDVSGYGFSMEYRIHPREFERGKIFKIVYPDKKGNTIHPKTHFAPIVAYIKNIAVQKYGSQVATAYDPDAITQQPLTIAAAPADKKTEIIQLATTPNLKDSQPEIETINLAPAQTIEQPKIQHLNIATATTIEQLHEPEPIEIAAVPTIEPKEAAAVEIARIPTIQEPQPVDPLETITIESPITEHIEIATAAPAEQPQPIPIEVAQLPAIEEPQLVRIIEVPTIEKIRDLQLIEVAAAPAVSKPQPDTLEITRATTIKQPKPIEITTARTIEIIQEPSPIEIAKAPIVKQPQPIEAIETPTIEQPAYRPVIIAKAPAPQETELIETAQIPTLKDPGPFAPVEAPNLQKPQPVKIAAAIEEIEKPSTIEIAIANINKRLRAKPVEVIQAPTLEKSDPVEIAIAAITKRLRAKN